MRRFLICVLFFVLVFGIFDRALADDEEKNWGLGMVYNHSFMYTGAEELLAKIVGPEAWIAGFDLDNYGEFIQGNQKGIAGLSFEAYSTEDNLLLRITYAVANKSKFRGYLLRGYSHETRYSIKAQAMSFELQKGFYWNRSRTLVTGIGGGFNLYGVNLNEEHNNESSSELKSTPFFSISQRVMLMKRLWLEIGYQRNLLSPGYEFTVDADLWSDSAGDPKKIVNGLEIEQNHFLIRFFYRF